MPHSFLKSIKLNLAQYAAVALAYAEGIARRYAEKKILEILDELRKKCPPANVLNKMNKSLDRVDSSKGYIEGNVQWVHKMVNMSKQQYTQEEFIEMCTAVVNKVKW